MRFKNFFFKLAHWETWHYLAKYIPISPAWFWYCLRARSPWFFTPSNPSLTFGGFEGEPKHEMYEQLPPGAYPNTIVVSNNLTFRDVEKLVTENNFHFPFIVKPDAGMMGFLFRKMNSWEELKQYHEQIPFDYLVQEYVDYPLEVSVFYYRFPNERKGTITGFIRKEFLQVKGDGHSTLSQLMEQYPRVRFRLEEMKAKHVHRLDDIIPAGEIYFLSYALNLSRGGKLTSLEHEKDERLLKVFDDISHYTQHFYYGRYDIKCASIEDLKNGINFSILEYNGCGAEPHHVYGSHNTLIRAYSILLHHWKILFKISRYNHRQGIRQWEFRRGWKYLREGKKHFRELRRLDKEILIFPTVSSAGDTADKKPANHVTSHHRRILRLSEQ